MTSGRDFWLRRVRYDQRTLALQWPSLITLLQYAEDESRIAAAYERENSPWSAMKPYIDMRKR